MKLLQHLFKRRAKTLPSTTYTGPTGALTVIHHHPENAARWYTHETMIWDYETQRARSMRALLRSRGVPIKEEEGADRFAMEVDLPPAEMKEGHEVEVTRMPELPATRYRWRKC